MAVSEGGEGITVLKNQPVDAVLVDLFMPFLGDWPVKQIGQPGDGPYAARRNAESIPSTTAAQPPRQHGTDRDAP
jgi:CheY-like chemotaxis protein